METQRTESGTDTILIVVIILIIVGFIVWWFTMYSGSTTTPSDTTPINVNVDLPATGTSTVTPGL